MHVNYSLSMTTSKLEYSTNTSGEIYLYLSINATAYGCPCTKKADQVYIYCTIHSAGNDIRHNNILARRDVLNIQFNSSMVNSLYTKQLHISIGILSKL